MKNVTKFLSLGLIPALFGTILISSTYAQATDEVCKPIYEKMLANRKGPELDKFKVALAAGKEFQQKCKDWGGQEQIVVYVNGQVPKLEQIVKDMEEDLNYYQPYYKSISSKDWAKSFSLGKWIVNKNADDVDHPIVLAQIGYDLSIANPPVDTYNADTIAMAKTALKKLEEGKPSGSGEYGNFKSYTLKTASCADGKVNSIGWMNYIIGNIMFTRMNQKKEALPYLYKASQVGCQTKDEVANVYRHIGNYYIDEFIRIEKDKTAAYDKVSKMKKDDPEFAAADKTYQDLVALQKGYMERIMDAFARSYRAAVKAKENAAFVTAQLNRAKEFYGFRHGKTPKVPFDTWLIGATAKPFPDPTTAVTPIFEVLTTTTTPSSMTTGGDASTNATGADTRPRTAPTASGAKPTPTTKAPAKGATPKKKGQ